MIKKSIMYMFLFILLSGCSDPNGKELFFSHMDQLEEALDEPDWNEIQLQANELKDVYETSKWKLQLLGDEGEYEGLNESIQKMIAVVKEEDRTNIRMELATARSLVADIYSF